MARTLTTKQSAASTATLRKITHLFFIDALSAELRFSSRGLITWNGRTWAQVGARLERLSTGIAGTQTCSFSLPNHRFTWSSLILAQNVQGRTMKVWRLMGDPPYAISDAFLLFSGIVRSVPKMDRTILIEGRTKNAGIMRIPNVFLGPPQVNHMPKAGTVVQWRGVNYILQPREDNF